VTEDVDKVLQLPPDELEERMKVVRTQLQQGKGSFFQLAHSPEDFSATSTERTALLGASHRDPPVYEGTAGRPTVNGSPRP
jgi:hypothetical protein